MHNAKFSPARLFNLMMVAVMTGSVAFSLTSFLSNWIAVPVALTLGGIFNYLAHAVVEPDVPHLKRATHAIAAGLIFLLTCGLSYGALYLKLFADTSALKHFETARLPLMQQMHQQLGNAEAAQGALLAWQSDAAAKATAEETVGGTCATKAASTGKPGAISQWRRAERNIAETLSKDFTNRVSSLRSQLTNLDASRAATYSEMRALGDRINLAVNATETLTHGAFAQGVAATLERQGESTITWKNGEVFICGDAARDETLARATTAVAALLDSPVLKKLSPVLDLDRNKDVMVAGLLRGFNLAAFVVSFGRFGSFADDALMTNALAHGAINSETLPFAIAAVLELCVLLTAAWAAHGGAGLFPPNPVRAVAATRRAAQRAQTGSSRLAYAVLYHALRVIVGLFFIQKSVTTAHASQYHGTPTPASAAAAMDPVIPDRELTWAADLVPFIAHVHDRAYLFLTNVPDAVRARKIARCLHFQGIAQLITGSASWSQVSEHTDLVPDLLRLPDAETRRYEVYALAPGYVQAARLAELQVASSPHKIEDAPSGWPR